MANLSYKSLPFDVTETGEKQVDGQNLGVVKGYAAAFSADRVNDRIERNAFDNTLKEHRNRGGRPIRLKYQHASLELIGGIPIDSVVIDDVGLFVTAHINLDVQRGKEAYALAKQGVLNDMSIGFIIRDAEFQTEDGIEMRVIKDIDLHEVSIVDEPANMDAVITEVKSATRFLDLPLASRDREWDEDEAIPRIREFTNSIEEPSRIYRNAFMFYDAEKPDEFGSYKLPYADVINDELVAIPRAIFAIAGVLRGARGGVDLPPADRERIIRHVERYYQKMGIDSPFNEERSLNKIDYQVVKHAKTQRDLERILKTAGFSERARKYLASQYQPSQPWDVSDCESRDVSQKDSNETDEMMSLNKKLDDVIKRLSLNNRS